MEQLIPDSPHCISIKVKQFQQEIEPRGLAGGRFRETLIDWQIKGFRYLTFHHDTDEPVCSLGQNKYVVLRWADTTGQGHISRGIEGPRNSLFILVPDDYDVTTLGR